MAVLFYNTLRHGMDYTDPGASYYEDRYRRRVLTNLQRRAKSLRSHQRQLAGVIVAIAIGRIEARDRARPDRGQRR